MCANRGYNIWVPHLDSERVPDGGWPADVDVIRKQLRDTYKQDDRVPFYHIDPGNVFCISILRSLI